MEEFKDGVLKAHSIRKRIAESTEVIRIKRRRLLDTQRLRGVGGCWGEVDAKTIEDLEKILKRQNESIMQGHKGKMFHAFLWDGKTYMTDCFTVTHSLVSRVLNRNPIDRTNPVKKDTAFWKQQVTSLTSAKQAIDRYLTPDKAVTLKNQMHNKTQGGVCYDEATILSEVCTYLSEHAVEVTAPSDICTTNNSDDKDPRDVLLDMAADCYEPTRVHHDYQKEEQDMTPLEARHELARLIRTHRRRTDIPTLVKYELALSQKHWHPLRVKGLLDDDSFCKRLYEGKPAEDGLSKTDEITQISIYEQLVQDVKAETKDRCPHRLMCTYIDYAFALSKDVSIRSAMQQSTERGIIRCLVSAARLFTTAKKPEACKCKSTHYSLFNICLQVVFMYNRLGLTNLAARFLWEITDLERSYFTQVEAVNLLVLYFAILHGAVPCTMADMPMSEGLCAYLPQSNKRARPAAKAILSTWRTRMMKYAKIRGAVRPGDIEDLLQATMNTNSKLNRDVPLGDMRNHTTQPTDGNLCAWLKYILNHVQEKRYDQAVKGFRDAEPLLKTSLDKTILAANYASLLLALRKPVMPALYPLMSISSSSYTKPGWAPTPLSKVLLNVLRCKPTVLHEIVKCAPFLLTPEAKSLHLWGSLKRGTIEKDDALRTIYSSMPFNLSTPEGAAIAYAGQNFAHEKADPHPIHEKKAKKPKMQQGGKGGKGRH